jgi:hypothetical protein
VQDSKDSSGNPAIQLGDALIKRYI